MYKKNENGEWRLVLANTFHINGKNLVEEAMTEVHSATAHGGVEKTLKWLTDKFICQPFSRLIKEYWQVAILVNEQSIGTSHH